MSTNATPPADPSALILHLAVVRYLENLTKTSRQNDESIPIAIDCLRNSFGFAESGSEAAARELASLEQHVPWDLSQIFASGLRTLVSEKTSAPQKTERPSEESIRAAVFAKYPGLESDPKFQSFLTKISESGYFKVPNEYESRLIKAIERYQSKMKSQTSAALSEPKEVPKVDPNHHVSEYLAQLSDDVSRDKRLEIYDNCNALISACDSGVQYNFYKSRGYFLLGEDRFGEAVDDLKRCGDLKPSDLKTRVKLTLALRSAERYAEAIVECEKVLAEDPSNRVVIARMEECERLSKHHRQQQQQQQQQSEGGEGEEFDMSALSGLLSNPQLQNMAQMMMNNPAFLNMADNLFGNLGATPNGNTTDTNTQTMNNNLNNLEASDMKQFEEDLAQEALPSELQDLLSSGDFENTMRAALSNPSLLNMVASLASQTQQQDQQQANPKDPVMDLD